MADFHIYIGYRTVSSWSMRGWLPLKKSRRAVRGNADPLPHAGGQGAARPGVADRQGAVPRPRARRQGDQGVGFARHRRIPRRAVSASGACGRRTRRRAPTPARSRRRCIPASGRCASISPWRFSSATRIPTTRRPTPTSPASRRSGASAARRWGKAGGGPFLFGHWTVADAMYAPVVTRFRTYGVKLGRDRRGLHGGGAGRSGFPRLGGSGPAGSAAGAADHD